MAKKLNGKIVYRKVQASTHGTVNAFGMGAVK